VHLLVEDYFLRYRMLPTSKLQSKTLFILQIDRDDIYLSPCFLELHRLEIVILVLQFDYVEDLIQLEST